MSIAHKYAANFILDTRDYKDSVESLVDRLRRVVSDIGGEVSKLDNHGQKDFSRVANRKFPNGIYVTIEFEGPADAPSKLQDKLRLDKTVDRIMVQSVA